MHNPLGAEHPAPGHSPLWNQTMLPSAQTHPEFYAGVAPKRLFAWVIDMVIIMIIGAILTPFTAFSAVFFFPLFVAIVGFMYRVITLSNGSATWGMRVMSIELRQADGSKLEFISAVLHTTGLYVSFALPIVQLISMLMMASQPTGKGVTDLILGTVMINKTSSM